MSRKLALVASLALVLAASVVAVAQPANPPANNPPPATTPPATTPPATTPPATTPPATPEGTEGQTTTSSANDEGMDAGTYAVRLRDLEQRINELKEQIFRSKGRLSLLAETVLSSVVAGAQLQIMHENQMSASYRLVKVLYLLDGASIFSRADPEGTGTLGDMEEFEVFRGAIVPGEHTLTVNLEYRGHGYGVFSYLKGYRFKVRSNYTFTAPEGRGVVLRSIGLERGGATAPLEERPAIRYVERVVDSIGEGTEAGREAEAATPSEEGGN